MCRALALILTVCGTTICGMARTDAAQAAPVCAWADDPTAPAFDTPGRSALYHRGFTCTGAAQGSYTLRFDAIFAGQKRTIHTDKGNLKPWGRWPRSTPVQASLAPSQICDFPVPPGAATTLTTGYTGLDLEPSVPVAVEAVFDGQGDLAGLGRTERVTVHCPACPNLADVGEMGLYAGRAMADRVAPGVRVQAAAKGEWYACARQGATLSVRYFAAADTQTAERAIRPTFEQTGLEKQFRVRGAEAILDVPVPVDTVCRKAGPAVRTVAVEVVGTGLLGELGGGGRSYLDLKCR